MGEDPGQLRATYFKKLSRSQTKSILYPIEPHSTPRSAIKPMASFDGDIVALHGLNGHFFNTWAYSETFWLSDLLPCAFPKAQIFSFSYASKVFTNYKGEMGSFARSLLNALRDRREHNERQTKPILFICHSLGGLVVKKAMCVANEDPRYTDILQSTKVITFMGTPHRGSDYAKKVRQIAKLTNTVSEGSIMFSRFSAFNRKLIGDLEPHSSYLAELSSSFTERLKDIRIVSFYEKRPPKGYKHLIVEEDSAKLQVPEEDPINLDYDHLSMCKVNSSEENCHHFTTILAPIRRQLEKALELMQNIDLPTSELIDWQFRDRDAELNELKKLDAQFSRDKNMLIVLLHGSSGMGKTELALKFLKFLQPRYRYQFAIDAESEETLQESFRRIAERLRITTISEPGELASARVRESAQIVSNVRHRLTNTNVPWVLMFDNYSAAFNLKQYFPSKNQGVILVCAADRPESRSLIGAEEQCTIHVGPMKEQCLTRLFWSAVTGNPDYTPSEEHAKEAVAILVQKLACHTLSIKLAASFFVEDKKGLATVEGLNHYIRVIDQQPSDYSKDINDKLWKAWQMLIGKLRDGTGEAVDDAIEYLCLRAIFSHRHLPTSLLFRNVARQRHDDAWVKHEYIPAFLDHRQGFMKRSEQAERLLSRYGLVTIENVQDVRGTRMLKVLRLCARQLLWDQAPEQQLHLWCSALCTLGESIKWSFEHEDVAFRKSLVPHIDACFQVDGQSSDRALSAIENRIAGNILLNFAAAYTDVGRFGRAGELQNEALERLMADPEPGDDLTLRAKGEIASNHELNDKFEDAFKLRKEVLEQREKCYLQNKNDRTAERKYDTAAAFAAISYARLPAYGQEALTLREMRLAHVEKALGNSSLSPEERPGRLTLPKAKRELATSYFEMDRKSEALRLREEVVDALDQDNDVFTLNARRELLISLSNARQLDRALDLGSSIVEDSKLLLGPDHPDTWLALSALATVKSRAGQSEDARNELKDAVDKFSEFWGVDHSITVDTRVELARAKLALNEEEEEREAMDIFRETSRLFESSGGSKNSQKLRYDLEMAMVVQRRGSRVALNSMKMIVSELESILPKGDSSLIFAKLKLGGCHAQFGEIEEAASEYERILALFEGDVPQTSRSLKAKLGLALTYLHLAADRSREERSDFETLRTGVPGRMTYQDDLLPASDKPSKLLAIRAAFRAGVGKLKPKASVETIRPESDHGLVYRGFDRAQLRQEALELRAQVVAATTVFEGTEYRIRDQLAARACFELSESYVQHHRYQEAIDLQRAVVLFHVQNFGVCSRETQQHQGMLRSWEMMGRK